MLLLFTGVLRDGAALGVTSPTKENPCGGHFKRGRGVSMGRRTRELSEVTKTFFISTMVMVTQA